MLPEPEKKQKIVILTGPNASGKSGLGIRLAEKYGAEIVSADSRQVYRGLDLGSGKVTEEEMRGIPHHLLDVTEPGEVFSLADFQRLACEALDGIHKRGKKAFLVGGTGLYVNSVAEGYDLSGGKPDPELRRRVEAMELPALEAFLQEQAPELLAGLDRNNRRRLERAAEKVLSGDSGPHPNRPRYETLELGTAWPREVLYERIRERLDRRLRQGMIGEVEGLRAAGVPDSFLYGLGLEYRYILMYLRGEFPDHQAFYDKLFMEIRHLAKEQMTWFRKRPALHWLDMTAEPFGEACGLIDAFYGREIPEGRSAGSLQPG